MPKSLQCLTAILLTVCIAFSEIGTAFAVGPLRHITSEPGKLFSSEAFADRPLDVGSARPSATIEVDQEEGERAREYLLDSGAPPADKVRFFSAVFDILQAILLSSPSDATRRIRFLPEMIGSRVADFATYFVRTLGIGRTTMGGPYEYEIAGLWRQELRRLARSHPNARILDLASGRFGLTQIALEVAREENAHFELYALDKANLPPEEIPDGVHFYSAPMEAMPFPNDSFDFVMSMHGFGYGDSERSLSEIARTLKPEGLAVLVTHHSNSPMVRNMPSAIAQANMLDAIGLYPAALALLRKKPVLHLDPALETALSRLEDLIEITKSARHDTRLLTGALSEMTVANELLNTVGRPVAWLYVNYRHLLHQVNREYLYVELARASTEFSPEAMRNFGLRAKKYGLQLDSAPRPIESTFHKEDGDPEKILIGWEIRLSKPSPTLSGLKRPQLPPANPYRQPAVITIRSAKEKRIQIQKILDDAVVRTTVVQTSSLPSVPKPGYWRIDFGVRGLTLGPGHPLSTLIIQARYQPDTSQEETLLYDASVKEAVLLGVRPGSTILQLLRFTDGVETEFCTTQELGNGFDNAYWDAWDCFEHYYIYSAFIDPWIERMIAIALSEFRGPRRPLVVDLLGGNGRLIERLREQFTRADYALIDRNAFLLEQAVESLMVFGVQLYQRDIRTVEDFVALLLRKPDVVISSGGLNKDVLSREDAHLVAERIFAALPASGLWIVTGWSSVLLTAADFSEIGFNVLNRSIPKNSFETQEAPGQFYVLRKPASKGIAGHALDVSV